MAQTSTLKAPGITNLDATPPLANTTGEYGAGYLKTVDGFVIPLAADNAGSTYQLVRIPTNAKVKSISLESEAQGAGKVNISVYYSDGVNDGTSASNSGKIVPTTGDQFFASDVDLSSAYGPTNVTNESGNYPLNLRALPLWSALGLATDPGGFFDLVAVVHTTAITTGTGRLGLRCDYVE